MVHYLYDDNDLGYYVGDKIFVLYLAEDPDFSYDYRYLKEDGGYALDEQKYQKQIEASGFSERPHWDNGGRIKIKLW